MNTIPLNNGDTLRLE